MSEQASSAWQLAGLFVFQPEPNRYMNFERSDILQQKLDDLSANDSMLFWSLQQKVLGEMSARGTALSTSSVSLVFQAIRDEITQRAQRIVSEISRVLDGASIADVDDLARQLKAELSRRLDAAAQAGSTAFENGTESIRRQLTHPNMPTRTSIMEHTEAVQKSSFAEVDLFCQKLRQNQVPKLSLHAGEVFAQQDISTGSTRANCRVFISYSHDSIEHERRVLELAERLRDDGVDAQLDQYVGGTPQEGWPRWMLNQLDSAQFILVVCTKTYYRRFRGHEERGKGKGADWEGSCITLELYHARSETTKFVPVLFEPQDEPFVPGPLSGHTHYLLNSENNYNKLYAFLTGQAGVVPRKLGPLKALAREPVEPLTFRGSVEETSTAPTRATRSTVPDREAFEAKHDLIVEIAIKTSPIGKRWRVSWSRRVLRMPRHYIEDEGFNWNPGILAEERFWPLVLSKAKLDSDNNCDVSLGRGPSLFEGDLGDLGQPHEMGDGCQLWVLPDETVGLR
jgi:SEFIR domain